MSEYIDPIVVDAVEGKRLPDGHRAKSYAIRLPAWHPVRELFTGPSQWLGQIGAVYCLLKVFSEVYADYLLVAGQEGLLQAAAPPDCEAERAAFERIIPNDVLYRGHAYKFRRLRNIARASIETMTAGFPPIRTVALADFDNAFAKLVRAVRWS